MVTGELVLLSCICAVGAICTIYSLFMVKIIIFKLSLRERPYIIVN